MNCFQKYILKYCLQNIGHFVQVSVLKHWGQDKMATIFADDVFKFIFWCENWCISIQISLKFAPIGLFNNKPSFAQITAWYWSGDKLLFEPKTA